MATRVIKHYVSVGQRFMAECPFSEVCMHMGVAGELRMMEYLECSVQIYDLNSRPMGGAVTLGEAGLLTDDQGVYFTEYRESK